MSEQPNCIYCYDDGRPCSACGSGTGTKAGDLSEGDR